MDKKTAIYRILLLLLAIFIFPSLVFSAQKTKTISIEELTQMYGEETVFTASKREQKISESPSAISIITAEDIKQSGATQISEALQMVVGSRIGTVLSEYPLSGGSRSVFRMPMNKIVFLIDGVPWMWEVYGIAGMYPLPIALEEIERIEFMRGPGSSLYGPNAMFGVINVITKKPKDTQKSLVSLKAGELGTYVADYLYGGKVNDKLFYRLSLGFDRRDNWGYVAWLDDPAGKYGRYNTNIDYLINDNSTLNFAGSYIDLKKVYWISTTTGPILFRDENLQNATLTYTSKSPNIMVRANYQFKDLWDSGWTRGFRLLYLKMGSKSIEFQHTIESIKKNIFMWGANFTELWTKGALVQGSHRHDMRGVFFDNTYKPLEQLHLVTGMRYDHHPNTGDTYSHRLSLLYFPAKEHVLRFTWGSSFRNPDFIESYYYSASGPVLGHEYNDAEKAEILEIGYKGKLTEKLSAESNVYYTRVIDYIGFVQRGTRFDYENTPNIYNYGLETELKYLFNDWLSGVLNYTYIEQWEQEDFSDPSSREMTPQHMFNTQLRASFKNGFSANLSCHYRGATNRGTYNWTGDSRGITVFGGKAKDYLTTNLRLGYKFKLGNNDAEVGVAAWNLLDNRYDDLALSTQDVRRRIVGTFEYKF